MENILTKKRAEAQQLKEEKRQQGYVKEQIALSSGIEGDETYLHQLDEKKDLTRWQQDLDDTIEELRHNLMNEVFNGETWEVETEVFQGQDGNFYKRPVKPMVNSLGTYKLISIVKRYLNRNFMMSNLDEEIIYRMLRRLKTDIVINLGDNFENYNIDPTDLSIIVRMVVDSVEATLYRALSNGERNYLNTINKRVETFNANDNPQMQNKRGMLGVFG